MVNYKLKEYDQKDLIEVVAQKAKLSKKAAKVSVETF